MYKGKPSINNNLFHHFQIEEIICFCKFSQTKTNSIFGMFNLNQKEKKKKITKKSITWNLKENKEERKIKKNQRRIRWIRKQNWCVCCFFNFKITAVVFSSFWEVRIRILISFTKKNFLSKFLVEMKNGNKLMKYWKLFKQIIIYLNEFKNKQMKWNLHKNPRCSNVNKIFSSLYSTPRSFFFFFLSFLAYYCMKNLYFFLSVCKKE